jgi:hypothetical protein
MAHIDTGVTGAKRATWREINPRRLLRAIIDANPNGTEQEWRDDFWEQVNKRAKENEQSYIFVITQYWLDNNIRSLLAEDSEPDRAAQARSHQAAVEQVAQQTHALLLMRLTMPNGKLLGECTGADCKRFGGWYARIGKLVPARKIVGEVLTEDRLRELWDAR